MTTEPGRELGWDERIDEPDEGDFTIFPDGIYPFTIIAFERGRHTGSTKLPACNKAILSIEFDGGQILGTTVVKHNLFLHTKNTGLLAQFFRGIGLRKHGDPIIQQWDAVPGRKGYAKLGKRSYDGKDYPDIKKFIDPEDWPGQTPTDVAQPAQPAAPAQPVQPVQPANPVPPAQVDQPF
jgi:hypothetical protein